MNANTIADNAMENLIIKACGPRSLTQFAKDCGISPMHVSRMKSGDCTPSKKMCLKMGSEPYVKSIGLSSRDFLEAAGYRADFEDESIYKYERVIAKQVNTIAIGVISRKLMELCIAYQILPKDEKAGYDFIIQVMNGGTVTQWNFILSMENQIKQSAEDNISYYYNLGRILSLEQESGTQYTVVLDSKDTLERLEESANLDLVKANVTVVLMDLNEMSVIKEIHFGPDECFYSLAH